MMINKQSRYFRIVAWLLVIHFVLGQNVYAADQIQFNQEAGQYQPVKPVPGSIQSNSSLASASINKALPLINDFLSEGPLSPPDISSPLMGEDQGGGEDQIGTPHPDLPASAEGRIRPVFGGQGGKEENDEITGHGERAHSFEYALELIRPEFAAAIPIEDLSEEEFERLRHLDVEVAFVGIKGMKFLLTSGNQNEIKATKQIQELLGQASFFAHTHPEETESHEPSPFDLLAASGQAEYLITSEEILSYNKDGIQERNIANSEFLNAWKNSVILSEAKNLQVDPSATPQDDTGCQIASGTSCFRNDDDVEARAWANEFIYEMDRLNQDELIRREALRTAGTVNPDSTLANANLTLFSGSPRTLLMTDSSANTQIIQQSSSQFQINYDVTAAGSKSGAHVSFDNPATLAVEVSNLSAFTNFIVGISGPSGSQVKFEVEDSLGAKSDVTLINISATMQYYKISKTLFTGIDWTKIKRFNYSIDSTLATTLTGTLTIQTKTLLYSTVSATNFTGSYYGIVSGSSSPTILSSSSFSQFKLNYDLSQAGSFSGGSIVLDNPNTTTIEYGNLSAQTQFTFGLFGTQDTQVKLEFEDSLGAKSSTVLTGITTSAQYYSVSKGLFTGLDWTKIKRINFVVDSALGNPTTGTLNVIAGSASSISSSVTSLPNAPYLAISSGSSVQTTITQGATYQFVLNYDVSAAGSVSGASIVLDNPGTAITEYGNLSSQTQFTFMLWGSSNMKVKLEFEDSLGAKSSIILNGIQTSYQYLTVSKDSFSGLDWTKIKQINFLMDPTLGNVPTGALTVGTKALAYSTVLLTNLPNVPYLGLVSGSSPATTIVETGSASFKFNYDVSQAGSVSGASVILDNPSTSAIEYGNLSSQAQFTFGLSGPYNGKIMLQFEDYLGVKSAAVLTGLTTSNRYFTVSKDRFTGIDWTKIKRINFIIDPTLGNPATGTINIQARTLTFSTVLATNLPGTPRVNVLSGSTNATALRQTSNAGFAVDFSLSGAGTKSGAAIDFDNPATGPIETQNLSANSQFVFSVSGFYGKVKLEMEDEAGLTASTILTGVTTGAQYYAVGASVFSGIDLTKVRRINFFVDSTLTTLTSGTFSVVARTLFYNISMVSALPGAPAPLVSAGSSATTYLTEPNSTQINLNYDVTNTGSFSGALFSFDHLSTPSVESQDLSQGNSLTFGLMSGNYYLRKIKIEIEDVQGIKASATLSNITTVAQYYTVQKSLFAGIDWTKVKGISLIVDRSMVTYSAYYKSWIQISLGGFQYSPTVVFNIGYGSYNLTTLPSGPSLFLLPNSSSQTTLSPLTNQFNLHYDVAAQGSSSGARVSFDKPSTTPVETGNLSTFSTLVFGLQAPSNTVRLELVDVNGAKSSVLLTNVQATERFFPVLMSSFTGIDKTKIKWVQFVMDPVLTNHTSKTGNLIVSLKGLTTPVLSAPVVNPVTSPTNQSTQIISGTKGLGTGIVINGVVVVPPSDATAWQTEVNLPTDGEHTFNIQETNGAGVLGPVTQVKIIHQPPDTTPPGTALLSSRYAYSRNYTLTYRVLDEHPVGEPVRTEVIQLAPGKNEITRTVTDLYGNSSTVSWNIFLDENAERGTFFDYDANGNVISRIDSNGQEAQYEYDSDNRLTKVTYADGSTVRYAYNARGDRAGMEDSNGVTFYSYDSANRLVRVQRNNDVISYTYDKASNLVAIAYGGMTVRYTYDAANRLTEVREQRPAQTDQVTTYIYNDAGDLISKTLPNGIQTTYSYDDAGRLTGISHQMETSPGIFSIISTITYTLDAAGNRTSMRIFNVNELRQDRILEYTYDLFGRLIQEKDSDFGYMGNTLRTTVNYTYDAAGNRLTKEFIPAAVTGSNPRVLTHYAYGIDNRLESLTEEKYDAANVLLNSRTETFIYDAAGNLIQKITPEQTFHYDYDSEHRLVLWTDEKDVVEFLYDGDGNRVAKRVNGVLTNYIVDPNRSISQVLAELNYMGKVEQTYTYGLERVSAYSVQRTADSYYLQDGLSSVIGLADPKGMVTNTYSYDAFGNRLGTVPASQGTVPNSFTYTGEQLDSETGLIYLRHRYYDPTLGRFLSRDPVIGRQDQTQSLNPYPYVQNNPVNRIDPQGDEYLPPYYYDQNIMGSRPIFNDRATTDSNEPFIRDLGPLYLDIAQGTISNALYYLNPWIGLSYAGYQTFNAITKDRSNANIGGELVNWGVSTALSALGLPGDIIGSAAGGAARRATEKTKYGKRSDFDRIIYGNPPGGGSGGSFNIYGSGSSYYGGGFTSSLTGAPRAGSRGGVLLDKALSITGTSINDITGVTFDPYTGQVVLLGKTGGAVPEISVDYLITALKAIFGTQEDPGVTIDPVLDANGNPDFSRSQNVIHFGDIEDTALGRVVFEADRFMKSINFGRDNETGTIYTKDGYNISQEYIASRIPGFKNMLERYFEAGTSGERRSRFWFVPKEMELVRSAGQETFVFDQNSVKLLTEDLLVGGGATDPTAEAYARFFTDYYQQFVQLYPIYKELEKAARAVAFAKFIRDHDIPVDLSWLANASLAAVPTPRTTPVGSNSKTWTSGDTQYTLTIQGGVTVDFINGQNFTYLADTAGQASTLHSNSLFVRPSDLSTVWNFNSGATQYEASALSLAPTRKDANFYWQEPDLNFDTKGNFDLEWSRFYDSFSPSSTRLGFGWHFTPYTIESTETSLSYFINGTLRNLFPKLRFSDRVNQQTEDMVLVGTSSDGTLVYSPDGKVTSSFITVNLDNSFTVQYKDRRKVHFLADGRLDHLEDQNGNRIDYAYDTLGRLSTITDVSSGRQISLAYDASGCVSQVSGPEGKTITYTYDSLTGDLKTATESWTGRTTAYTYDSGRRLLKAIDHTGKTLFVNNYDEIGRLTSHTDENGNLKQIVADLLTHQTLSTDPLNGAQAKQTYDSMMRLTSTQDALGNQMNYIYGGAYGPTSVVDPRGNMTGIAYDSLGNPRSLVDPLNHTSRFDYSSLFGDTRLIFNEEGTGLGQFLEYHDTGNLKSLMEGVRSVRDSNGNLTGYYPTSLKTQFTYDANGNLAGVTDANLNTTGFLYDSTGNLTRVTNALEKTTSLTYETVTVDAPRHSTTAQGDAQIDTARFKFGGASAVFDGNPPFDSISVPDHSDFDFGAGDFTLEAWVNFNDPNWFNGVMSKYLSGTGWIFTINTSSGDMTLYSSGGSAVSVTSSFSTNVWYHVAVVKTGNVIKFFKNGIQQGSDQMAAATYNGNSVPLKIGVYGIDSGAFKGWIDEVRISKGVARWTSNFTPPTSEYAGDSNAKLLLHMNGTDGSTDFKDRSQTSTSVTNRLSQITDPLNRFINFSYDPVNEKVTRVANATGETNYLYDVRDRLNEIRDHLGRSTHFQYRDQIDKITETRDIGDALNPLDDIVAAFDYDRFGNLTLLAGPLGGATSFAYDLLNRLTRIVTPDSSPLSRIEQVKVPYITSDLALVRFNSPETVSRAILRVNEVGRAAYKTVTLDGPLSGDISFINVDGLTPGTEYEYEIEVIDAEAHHSFTHKRRFKTKGTPAANVTVKAEDLYGNVYDVTSASASIGIYNPDVNYGLIDYYRITATPSSGGTSIVKNAEPIFQGSDGLYYYSVISDVTGLQANTQYDYKIEIIPYAAVPLDVPPPVQGTFKTANALDTTVPQITGRSLSIDVDQAVLTLSTNEPLLKAEVGVRNLITNEVKFFEFFNPVSGSQLMLSGLNPQTAYAYWIYMTDLSGNDVFSTVQFFSTNNFDGNSPMILRSRVIELTSSNTKIEVLADEVPASVKIEIREKNGGLVTYTTMVPASRTTVMSFKNLMPEKNYEYRVTAVDLSRNQIVENWRDLVIYSEQPSAPTQNSNGIFELQLDNTILNQAALAGVEGWAAELSKKFLGSFQDQYDFLLFAPSLSAGKRLSLETQNSTSDNENGSFYWGGYNNVQGIGLEVFDARSFFGSSVSGEFEGMLVLDSGLSSGPDFRFSSSDFAHERNLTLWQNILTQELSHRFGSFLTSQAGNPYGILGRDFAHWNVFFDADFSPMDGNNWVDNGDGTFTLERSYIDEAAFKRTSEQMPYNDLDLYSMGLLDSSQVGTSFVIDNPTLEDGRKMRSYRGIYVEIEDPVTHVWSGPYYLSSDTVIYGTRRNVSLSDITALEGLRNPAFGGAQKDFKVAFIDVTNEEDDSIDRLEMSTKLNSFRNSFTNFFNQMSRGVGSILSPQGQTLSTQSSAPLLSSSIAAGQNLMKPLFSHFHFDEEPFEPIDRLDQIMRNFEAGLNGSKVGGSISLAENMAQTLVSNAQSNRPFIASLTEASPLPALDPVNLSASMISNLAAGAPSLDRPLFYSDWKKLNQALPSDPFQVDPVLRSSLPLLISPEINDQKSLPAPEEFEDKEKVKEDKEKGKPSETFTSTPLVWNALVKTSEDIKDVHSKFDPNYFIKQLDKNESNNSDVLTQPNFLLPNQINVNHFVADWYRFFLSNTWNVQGVNYCNPAHGICIENVPRWIAYSKWHWWSPFQPIINFVILKEEANEYLTLRAEVSIYSYHFQDALKTGKYSKYETETSLENLAVFTARMKSFKQIESKKIIIQGKESASAKYELTGTHGEPLFAEAYAFVHRNRAYILLYRSPKEHFVTFHGDAMKIIESFRFKPDQKTED